MRFSKVNYNNNIVYDEKVKGRKNVEMWKSPQTPKEAFEVYNSLKYFQIANLKLAYLFKVFKIVKRCKSPFRGWGAKKKRTAPNAVP
jgi:hypothetical protein